MKFTQELQKEIFKDKKTFEKKKKELIKELKIILKNVKKEKWIKN